MRVRNVILLTGLLLAPARGLDAQGSKSAATDSARLQGTWVMVAGSADGYPMPAEMTKAMKRVADGPFVTITMNDQLYFKAHFVLKPDASPKEIDYQMMEGPTKGATQLGVYRIGGDTLWFSFGAPGAARAADFTSKAGDGRTISAWVKIK